MNTEELCQYYKDLAEDVGFEINDKDHMIKTAFDTSVNEVVAYDEISIIETKDTRTKEVAQHRVVLPTRQQLSDPEDKTIVFHPISEVLDRGMSPTAVYLKDQIITTIMDKTVVLAVKLAEVFSNTEDDINYTPKQLAGISFNKGMSKTACATVKKILSRSKYSTPKRRAVSMSVVSKTEYRGEKCRRVSTLTSPLYVELVNSRKGAKIWGVDINETQKKAFIALFDFIFTGMKDGEYSHASNNGVAPYFDSMVRCFLMCNQRLDTLAKDYESVFKTGWPFARKEGDYSWLELLNNLGTAKRTLTTQHGNVGNAAAKPTSQQQKDSLQVHEVGSNVEEVVEEKPASGGSNYKPNAPVNPVQTPIYATAPTPYQQPVQQYNQPVHQYQQPVQPYQQHNVGSNYGGYAQQPIQHTPHYQTPQYNQPQQQPINVNGVWYIQGAGGTLIPANNTSMPQQQYRRTGFDR